MKIALAGVGNVFTTRGYYGTRLRGWVIAGLVVFGISVVITAAVYGITKAVRSAGAASCRTFARTSGYPSQYRLLHFLDGGVCFVRLPNGHTLPQKMVVAYLKANR